jgi:probable metal-binding protein
MTPRTSEEPIHGHEVISMMMASDEAYTRESLAAAIRQKFGPQARFYTCSASNLTPEDLVTFLEQRGKFTPRDDGFTINPSRVCQH